MSTPSADFPYPSGPLGDPPAEYARLRAEDPLTRVRLPTGHEVWLATRYEDVVTVTSDPRFSRDDRYLFMPIPADGAALDPDGRSDDDAPRAQGRRRLRQVLKDALRPRQAHLWQHRVSEAVQARLDALEAVGPPADLVREYAFPVPIAVVCELLGIPDGDRDRFHRWANIRLSVTAYSKEEVAEAYQAYEDYVRDLIARRLRAPQQGLLDALIEVWDRDDRITEYDLRRLVRGLITAGHQASTNMITRGVLLLLRHPAQLARLRRDPGLIDGAVEEILRFNMPGDTGVPRVAEEDVVLTGGTVRKGEVVLAPPVSANRDEGRFRDADRFDIGRSDNAHLAFGHGMHYCLGSSPARIELRTAIGMLVERFPGLDLALPAERLVWTEGLLVSQLEELPVIW